MKTRRFNWPVWAGFLLSLVAFLSYFFVFIWFPVTRDFPWANLVLFAVAAALLFVGLRRAFAPDRTWKPKVVASVLATLSVLVCGVFVYSTLIMAARLPASEGAPQLGQTAPDFSLSDTDGKQVSLAGLIASPLSNGSAPKGVLLIFYRGYW
ncbi:MAG: hypothetical protein H7Z38_17550 [Rubrivivax sp.]|nr:hypothetical protein [Pyrinomonadaceae bacterium]